MPRTRIYEDKNLMVYAKKDLYLGEEADLADTLLEVALIGHMKFASHLKDPDAFWREVEQDVGRKLMDVRLKEYKDRKNKIPCPKE